MLMMMMMMISFVVQRMSLLEMDKANRVQNLDEAVRISHSINILGKGMNPIILYPGMGKQYGRLGSLTFVWQPV